MANPARHNSNLNNEYIEMFQNIVRESQSEGYYDAEWVSGWDYWPDKDQKKIEVAAQEVCNRTEFKGVSYEMESDTSTHEYNGVYYSNITVKFIWI